jgi:ubiquinone/menaquinone biosynthesis C-methylase UbiE
VLDHDQQQGRLAAQQHLLGDLEVEITAERETADVESSSDDYARRFAGPSGAWMLQVQERGFLELLSGHPGVTVLDVGGGHGQLALPLARRGWRVTVVASDPVCRRRIDEAVNDGLVRFVTADLLDLPFADRSFDTVVSVRMLTHCRRWERYVAELCRVAARAVLVDYPTSESVNRVAPALFGAKKKLEGNTRLWRLFRHREVEEAFAAAGFEVHARRPQFFFPMVLHRMLRGLPASRAIEGVAAAAGLTRRWGSPVILEARRPADSR